jgi:hypothetical protein
MPLLRKAALPCNAGGDGTRLLIAARLGKLVGGRLAGRAWPRGAAPPQRPPSAVVRTRAVDLEEWTFRTGCSLRAHRVEASGSE